MPKYSISSEAKLDKVHPKLVDLFRTVLLFFDHSILGGIRTLAQQKENVRLGLSQTMNSMHLPQADGLSHALDVAPFPQHWDDSLNSKAKYTPWQAQLFYFAGFVMGVAKMKGLNLRYGGDFNMNNNVMDSGFEDLDHFELKDN